MDYFNNPSPFLVICLNVVANNINASDADIISAIGVASTIPSFPIIDLKINIIGISKHPFLRIDKIKAFFFSPKAWKMEFIE